MLNNLILDIGNVICDWDPNRLVASAFDTHEEQQTALNVTVQTPDWLALDRGILSIEEAIERAQARTDLSHEGIAKIYGNLGTSLLPLQGTMDAMHKAKAAGVPIYILSNMQHHAWAYLKEAYNCWDACEGFLISCEVGLVKPDEEIYRCLCDTFSLTPESCVFVDDMGENIEAANAFGIQGVQLTDKHAGGGVVDEIVGEIVARC